MEEWGFETEVCVFECVREERVVLMWVLEGMVLMLETELEEELETVDELVEAEVGVEDEGLEEDALVDVVIEDEVREEVECEAEE